MIPLLGEEITLALIFQLLASENEVEKNKNKKIFFIIPSPIVNGTVVIRTIF
jgi:hypothetical protein